MALINATWKVTHAGVILLDWDDYMPNEPEIDRAFIQDRIAALGGSGSGVTHLTRRNLSHTVAFTQVRVFENDDEAREYMREHTVLLSDDRADCTIEWLRRDVSNTLEGAVITTYRARCENNHFIADYALRGGLLSEGGGGGGGGGGGDGSLYVSFRTRSNDIDDGGSYISIVGDDPDTDSVVVDGGGFGGGQYLFYGLSGGTGETDFAGWLINTYATLEMKLTPAGGGGWNVTPRVNGTPGDEFLGLTGSTINAVRFGGLFAGSVINRNMDDLKIGTTDWGSSDIFSADFASAIIPPFDSVVGAGCSIATGTLLVATTGNTDSYAIKALTFP